jgi:hypothetical protein
MTEPDEFDLKAAELLPCDYEIDCATKGWTPCEKCIWRQRHAPVIAAALRELARSQHNENCDSLDPIMPKPCNCYISLKAQLAAKDAEISIAIDNCKEAMRVGQIKELEFSQRIENATAELRAELAKLREKPCSPCIAHGDPCKKPGE